MGLNVSQPSLRNLLLGFLTSDGTASGTFNWVGDYSATPTEAFFAPPPGVKYLANSLQIGVGADAKLTQTGYGHLPALINGIDFRITVSGVDIDITPSNILDNNDLLFYGAGATQILEYAANKDTITGIFNLQTVHDDVAILLDGDKGDKVRVVLNDNFTGLLRHSFLVRGYY